ncbi:MAG: glycoside hydrolase family 9 protein [Bacteroidales bacterium]
MKLSLTRFLPLAFAFALSGCNSLNQEKNHVALSGNIRLNQLGYLPGSVKKVVVVNSGSEKFVLADTAGKSVYSGKLEEKGIWEASGEKVKIADFSEFNRPGKYNLVIKDLGSSYTFTIGEEVYNSVLQSSVKAFFLQRASTPIDEKFAGKYARPAAHPDNKCILHPSSGKAGGVISSPKGWYDAGDYNKYIVNAGFTVSMLLTLYENFPGVYSDNSGIPESGNMVSDLLDEVKYELDWAGTMQDKDGGVFFKLTSKSFCGFVKPAEDTLPRYVVGKSTSSTLNFAAMFAQASRVWRGIDTDLSAKYLQAAKRAWDWAVKNPAIIFRNPTDISTGEYGHKDFSGDFFWAAAELLASTGDGIYADFINVNTVPFDFVSGENWRNYLKNLGYYALALPGTKVEEKTREFCRQAIVTEADKQLGLLEKSPYRQPLDSFVWGSNSDILDLAVIFAQAYTIKNEKKYLDAVIETTDYIFGKNATGYSFVTGYGSKPAMNPHHRLSDSDGIPGPLTGFVVGGPNANLNDEWSEKATYGVKYPSKEPAKCYVDLLASYASNEIAINWNAPLAFITAFLVNQSKSSL